MRYRVHLMIDRWLSKKFFTVPCTKDETKLVISLVFFPLFRRRVHIDIAVGAVGLGFNF